MTFRTLPDLSSTIRFEVSHNSNIPTYEYVLGAASIEVKALRRTAETLEIPLLTADVKGHEVSGCGCILISARRTTARKIVSADNERRFSFNPEMRGSPRTTSFLSTFSGCSTPDGEAVQAFVRILVQLERLDSVTQEGADVSLKMLPVTRNLV